MSEWFFFSLLVFPLLSKVHPVAYKKIWKPSLILLLLSNLMHQQVFWPHFDKEFQIFHSYTSPLIASKARALQHLLWTITFLLYLLFLLPGNLFSTVSHLTPYYSDLSSNIIFRVKHQQPYLIFSIGTAWFILYYVTLFNFLHGISYYLKVFICLFVCLTCLVSNFFS